MSRRLYFLLPTLESCTAVVDELHQRGVTDRHIHVIGNHMVVLEGLHEASLFQKSEFGHGIEMGIGVGGNTRRPAIDFGQCMPLHLAVKMVQSY